MKYTVDYFISKFEAIPEEMWATGVNAYYSCDGKKCALGHCRVLNESFEFKDLKEEAVALSILFMPLMVKQHDSYPSSAVWRINDNNCGSQYKQPTPKQRILAALYDIKKLQEPTIKKVGTIAGEFIPVTFSEIKELQSAN